MNSVSAIVSSLAVFGLAACSPEAMFDGESSGNVIAPETPLIVSEGQPKAVMAQVSTGQPNLINAAVPTRFEAVDAQPQCRMPRPSRSAKIAYAYTYGGGPKTPFHYIADGANAAQIAARIEATKELVKDVASQGSFEQAALVREAAAFTRGNAIESATRVDVLVTETDAPVFLVLTSYNSVLWNIQAAPGVEIDGVIVNAYEGGAIANGARASRTGFMGHRGAPNRACRWKPRGPAISPEVRLQGALALNPDFDQGSYRETWENQYRADQTFYRQDLPIAIGQRPTWLLNDARGGAFQAVLVGPVPDVPFEQQPITRLQVPSYVAPYWGSRREAFAFFGL
ncbi:MAG: hypothetical protein AAGJ84_01370 [Pseudomonadota bacterium]